MDGQASEVGNAEEFETDGGIVQMMDGPRGSLDARLVRRFVREARLRRLARLHGQEGEPLSLEQLLAMHGQATMGVLLILLALITTVPVAGAGMLFSLGILAWAWRWARQQDAPALPRLRALKLHPQAAYRVLRSLAWIYSFAQRWSRPRWHGLQSPQLRWPWAVWVALMALIIFLPIPFGNVFPAVSLLLFGLGLLTRDGLMLLASLVLGLAGLGVLVAAGGWLWTWLAGWLA